MRSPDYAIVAVAFQYRSLYMRLEVVRRLEDHFSRPTLYAYNATTSIAPDVCKDA